MAQVHTNGTGQGAPSWTDYVHTGPGTLAGRYLRSFWQPVFRAQDLKPGKTTPIRVMSEDLTLYRGQSGDPHVLAFRCAHRGTQLSTGWVEGDNLRCRYHGLTYDPDGPVCRAAGGTGGLLRSDSDPELPHPRVSRPGLCLPGSQPGAAFPPLCAAR